MIERQPFSIFLQKQDGSFTNQLQKTRNCLSIQNTSASSKNKGGVNTTVDVIVVCSSPDTFGSNLNAKDISNIIHLPPFVNELQSPLLHVRTDFAINHVDIYTLYFLNLFIFRSTKTRGTRISENSVRRTVEEVPMTRLAH